MVFHSLPSEGQYVIYQFFHSNFSSRTFIILMDKLSYPLNRSINPLRGIKYLLKTIGKIFLFFWISINPEKLSRSGLNDSKRIIYFMSNTSRHHTKPVSY